MKREIEHQMRLMMELLRQLSMDTSVDRVKRIYRITHVLLVTFSKRI